MEISRRDFLKGTAASVASVGILGAFPAQVKAEETEDPQVNGEYTTEKEPFVADETVKADAVVVGAGISGMSAAIELAMGGVHVVLVEKEQNVGGTLVGTEGIYGGGSKFQQEQTGEPPMKHEVVTSELEFTNYRSDPLLWGDLFDAAGEDIDWLMEQVGIEFERCDNYVGQSKYPTFCWWTGENGGSAIPVFAAKLEELGITVMTGFSGHSIILEDGKVTGVNLTETAGEKKVAVQAPAVILATGGLANDIEYYGQKTGKDVSYYQQLFPIHETGDGLRMAVEAGAKETAISQMNVFGVRGYTDQDPVAIGGTIQPSMYVNGKGERFMAEDLCYKKFYALTTNAWEAQERVFVVLDSDYVDMLENEGCLIGCAKTKAGDLLTGMRDQLEEAALAEDPVVFRGETLEELAGNMGVDADTFTAQVEKYNGYCENGLDEDFGKSAEFLAPMKTGPFYAVRPSVLLFATMGGIDVNRDMEVLDTEGQPIEGLYCSGLACCNLYQETYNYAVSGGSNAFCCYSGRKAARTILSRLS